VVHVHQGRANFTTLSELLEGTPIMTGTFSINHQPVIIIFDSGATYSFISSKYGTKVGLDFYPTKGAYMIATPSGKISSNQVYRSVPIQLGRNLVKTDLLVFDLEGMDILLGMDWMTRLRVSLDISSRAVEIDSPDHGTTILYL
jgi:predicted aspartyl protease